MASYVRSFSSRLLPALLASALAAVGSLAAGCGDDPAETTGSGGSGAGTGTGGDGAGGGGGTGGGELVGEPLKIMTWNVENFYDDQYDNRPGPSGTTIPQCGVNVDGACEQVRSSAEYAAKRAKLAAVIQALDPDIIMVQEVENKRGLDDLNADNLGNKYPHRAALGHDSRGMGLGAMSKLPFDEVVSNKDESFVLEGTNAPNYTFARDCAEFHLTHNGRKIALLNVHFVSKGQPTATPPIPDNPDKRLAEAQRSRAIANELAATDPTLAIIILGDTNDLPQSPPYLALQGTGASAYTNAAELVVPASEQWTFDFNGKLELIDHMFSSPVTTAMLNKSSVLIHAALDEASDHRPLAATYFISTPE